MKMAFVTGRKRWFYYILLLFIFINAPQPVNSFAGAKPVPDEPPISVAEMHYQKLMKVYVNKIKLAFAETEDQRSVAILSQFLPEFSLKTDHIKEELQEQLKHLNARDKEKLLSRFRENSQTEELIALHFDERITSRTAKNAHLKKVMEQLHAKSLEVQQTGQQFLAAD